MHKYRTQENPPRGTVKPASGLWKGPYVNYTEQYVNYQLTNIEPKNIEMTISMFLVGLSKPDVSTGK
jgi:hypothetical protein